MITRELAHPHTQGHVLIRCAIRGSGTPIGTTREPNDLVGISLGVAQLDQMPHGIMMASGA
ncbi:hypothetical protein CYJ25_06500 [Schaalia turicensis]|uniref:Uncharacterized protein n=1 Tax=Schaalia turicensis TaxID=131111 RepID=A0A2I1I4H0_9ACTO|nr:hypothetical protein CYJ25_06500 [Schaalia turicensis]